MNRQQVRKYNIHEHESMDLYRKFGIDTPKGRVAYSASEAEEIFNEITSNSEVQDCVIKAQVLAGGRGKGSFTNGFHGGVQIATTAQEAREIASKMIGQRLVTKQTGAEGRPCHKVLVSERLFLRRETYFALLMDRSAEGPMMVGSPEGGMDIEAVAEKFPDRIFKLPIDITQGMTAAQAKAMASDLGFSGPARAHAAETFQKLYQMFIETDATMIEVNPLAETPNGEIMCIDAKLNFDVNAEFRQNSISSLKDESQVDPREVVASEAGLNYIHLDGNIGCLVNGAGLAMATMDVVKMHGGNPANFLDLGGGASESQVCKAFELLNSDPQVRAILVNIFGGIMRCDVIALGIIKAANTIGLKKPMVVRLAGTNVEEARKLIEDSGLRVLTAEDLEDAATKAVRVSEILNMADQVNVNVSFELPL
jgi:succinyl-CoA synthetase beta subunit